MVPALLSSAVYVKQAKGRRKGSAEALVIDSVTKPINRGVFTGHDLCNEPAIELRLHPTRHHFPSNALKFGLALRVRSHPFSEHLAVPQILKSVLRIQVF